MGRMSFHPPPLPAWPIMLAGAGAGLAAGLINMAVNPDHAVNAAGIWTIAAYGGGILGTHLARINNRTFMRGLTPTRETLEELLAEVGQRLPRPMERPQETRASPLPAIGAVAAPASNQQRTP